MAYKFKIIKLSLFADDIIMCIQNLKKSKDFLNILKNNELTKFLGYKINM